MSSGEPKKEDKEAVADIAAMLGMGSFVDGVSNLISRFGELAERGESLRKSMGDTEVAGKPIRTSGGFTVRFGGLKDNDEASVIKPVNTRPATPASSSQSQRSAFPVVAKERTANVELFEEDDHLLLLAEMPGVASEDVHLNFNETLLTIEGKSKTALFKAEVPLPKVFTPEQVAISANNGVVEIRLSNATN